MEIARADKGRCRWHGWDEFGDYVVVVQVSGLTYTRPVTNDCEHKPTGPWRLKWPSKK